MSDQTTFDIMGHQFSVNETGSVDVWYDGDIYLTIAPGEFRQLAEAQREVVWAAQHWTSLAQVNDALSSLLAVHPQVRVSGVYGQSESGPGSPITHYRVSLLTGDDLVYVESTGAVQDLFRTLNAAPSPQTEKE